MTSDFSQGCFGVLGLGDDPAHAYEMHQKRGEYVVEVRQRDLKEYILMEVIITGRTHEWCFVSFGHKTFLVRARVGLQMTTIGMGATSFRLRLWLRLREPVQRLELGLGSGLGLGLVDSD